MPRLKPVETPVYLDLDGRKIPAREGEPVAAALIASGEFLFARSPKYHRPRGPYCLTGACSQCLMRVDGLPNTFTCLTKARAGMRLVRQNALPSADIDILRAADFAFPKFLNHHEFLAGVPFAEAAFKRLARQLSGLGKLPDAVGPSPPDAVVEKLDTVIVGAGPAGIACAQRLAELGRPFALFERADAVGGGLRAQNEDGGAANPTVSARTGCTVVGLFADEGVPFLAVVQGGALHLVWFRALVLAHGGHPPYLSFPNCDLPGIMAGPAVATLMRVHHILPGAKVACVGSAPHARTLAEIIQANGGEAVAVGEIPLRAHGLRKVEAITTARGADEVQHACDTVAVCGPSTPAFELASMAGALVTWNATSATFQVEVDAIGRTHARGVYVAGELRGARDANEAAGQGRAVADAIAAEVGR